MFGFNRLDILNQLQNTFHVIRILGKINFKQKRMEQEFLLDFLIV